MITLYLIEQLDEHHIEWEPVINKDTVSMGLYRNVSFFGTREDAEEELDRILSLYKYSVGPEPALRVTEVQLQTTKDTT
jgi:hypothetical protein